MNYMNAFWACLILAHIVDGWMSVAYFVVAIVFLAAHFVAERLYLLRRAWMAQQIAEFIQQSKEQK